MHWKISKEFDFCYGHRVWSQTLNTEFSLDGCLKCRHLHGHQGKVIVYLQSEKLNDGMVTDFKHLNWFKQFLDDVLDHKFILDINDPLFNTLLPHYSDKQNLTKFEEDYYLPDLAKIKDEEIHIHEMYEGYVIVNFVPTSENISAWLLSIVAKKMKKLDVEVSHLEFLETPKVKVHFMLEINEIFGPTIQGEGKYVGRPSIFIRFGKCNFKCEGFNVEYETPSGIKKCACDSYFAVDKEFSNTWTKHKSYNGIVKEVDKLISNYNYDYKIDIVITGGEPLLYWNKEEFQKLIKHYLDNGHNVTIETNASLNLNIEHDYQKQIVFSMSVKLSNSLEPLKKRINYETLNKILSNTKESYLKFVIGKDFMNLANEEIKEILKHIPKCDVYLMPMGDTAKAINENSEDVINMAIKNGFLYCDRLHIRVWDNKRGV